MPTAHSSPLKWEKKELEQHFSLCMPWFSPSLCASRLCGSLRRGLWLQLRGTASRWFKCPRVLVAALPRRPSACSVPLALALLAPAKCYAASASTSPSAADVMARVVDRAAQVAKTGDTEKYTYVKQSLFEELSVSGAALHSTERTYQVQLIGGWPFSRLIKVQGVELTPADMARENQRERDFRNKLAGRDLDKAARARQPLVLPELIGRYNFTVLSNDTYQARDTVVLQFTPKPANPEATLQDRIYNRLAGCIWVDQQEAEVARLRVHLTEEFSLGWVGMLGSLKQCELSLDRLRMSDGTWVNARHTLLLIGRKLLSPMRYRTTEESSDFHRAP